MKTVVVNGKPRCMGGWKPDLHDHRDFVMRSPPPSVSSASLRPVWRLDIRDQGAKGTCTANASLEAAGFLHVRDGRPDPVFSRLFQYWVSRVKIEGGSAAIDSGCAIRDVVMALQRFGACPETMWPYSDDDVRFAKTPPQACFEEAAQHKVLFFYRCPDLDTIKASVAQGFPVVMGFNVPDNFMSPECAATGVLKMPAANEGFQGGHCMLICGWDDARQQVDGPNSWGDGWGDDGWFHLPYGMFEQGFVSDCWTLRRVQE